MIYKFTMVVVVGFLLLLQAIETFAITFNQEKPVHYYVNHVTELQSIEEGLKTNKVVGIVGLSGIGKSELVRKYIEVHGDEYEIVVVLNMSMPLNAQYLDVIHKINSDICIKEGCNISEDPQNTKENLFDYLNTKKNWLVVFDNLHVGENKKIQDIIEQRNVGHIIVCSQEGNYLDYQVKVPYLDNQSSNLLIKKIMKNSSQKYIDELTEVLQGHPYMIASSSMYLKNYSHITINDYMKYMKNKENKVKVYIELCLANMSLQAKKMLNKFFMLNTQKISRDFLSHMFVGSEEEFIKSLDELISYGLIEKINQDYEIQEFRMHDTIKNEMSSIIFDHGEVINQLLDRLNEYLPLNQTVPERYSLISQPTMLSNIEALVQNADEYCADVYKTMRGNDILLDHYLKIRDWENCAEKSEWLISRKKEIALDDMTNEQRITYGHYLTNIGVYQDFALSNLNTAINYYEEAKEILNETTGYYIIYNTAYFQQALTQISIGDLEKAEANLLVIENKLQENNVPINYDRVLGGRSKLSLAKGNYSKALREITVIEEAEVRLSNQTVVTPIHLVKAEILNYMEEFQEAYDICINLYKKESKNFKNMHEILARILVQLSRAELGLGKQELALQHIQEAISFFEQEYVELKHKHQINDKYAAALTARGDILVSLEKLEDAIRDYSSAKRVYFNRYRGNDRKMDNVSYNLLQLAKAAYENKEYKIYKNAREELFKKFGLSHPRSKKIIESIETQAKL